MIHHSRGIFLSTQPLPGWPLDQGVSFFVLSGFILVYVYPELPDGGAVKRFWAARIARLWPTHLFALLMLFVLLGAPGTVRDEPIVLPANLLMVHAWVPLKSYFFSYNTLSWTISTEAGFYVLFPLLIYRFSSTWWWKVSAAFALLVGLMIVCTVWDIPGFSPTYNGVTNFALLYISPLGRLFEFVLGMSAALLWLRLRPRFSVNVILWTVLEVGAIALFLWGARYWTWDMISFVRSSPLPVAEQWLIHASSCFVAAVLIVALAGAYGLVGKLLSLAPFVFLGEISYAMYMVHQILIRWCSAHLDVVSLISEGLAFPVFVAALLAISALIFLFVENPARKAIKRDRKPMTAASGPLEPVHFETPVNAHLAPLRRPEA